jgi:hypothetical protein
VVTKQIQPPESPRNPGRNTLQMRHAWEAEIATPSSFSCPSPLRCFPIGRGLASQEADAVRNHEVDQASAPLRSRTDGQTPGTKWLPQEDVFSYSC